MVLLEDTDPLESAVWRVWRWLNQSNNGEARCTNYLGELRAKCGVATGQVATSLFLAGQIKSHGKHGCIFSLFPSSFS